MRARVLVWMARRPYARPVVDEMVHELARAGSEVTLDYGGQAPVRVGERLPYDVCALKSHTDDALSAAMAAAAAGNLVVNPIASVLAVRDKAAANAMLAANGLPAPRTWLASDHIAAARALPTFPCVVKAAHGDLGRDVYVLRTATDVERLAAVPAFGPVVVQELVQGAGADLKVYGIGDRVYAVLKPHWRSAGEPGDPIPVPAEAAEIAARCRKLFALDVFGVDMIAARDGFRVVDVNHFPGFKGVPNAGRDLARFLAEQALAVAA